MKIETDSKGLEEPKDPETCNVFAIYKLMGSSEEINDLESKYRAGNFGYGHAKQALYELIIEKYKKPRKKYHHFMENPKVVEEILLKGAYKAKEVSSSVLNRVRTKIGY